MPRSRRFESGRTAALAATVAAVLALIAPAIGAQQIEHLEFTNAPVAEILVAIGRATGHSVVPDETVSGRATYYFHNVTFRSALAAFAARFDLFVDEADGIFTVSALRVSRDTSGRLTVEAPRVGLATLVRRLSRATRVPVLFERLPDREITYYADDQPLETVLRQIVAQLPDHDLAERDGAFLLAYVDTAARLPRDEWITRAGDRYTIASGAAALDDLLALLFRVGEREYQLLTRASPTVAPLAFADKSFAELLTLVLEQADATHAVVDGIYYITDRSRDSALARTVTTRRIALEHVSVATLLELLPGEQTAGVAIRPDRRTSSITLTGPERDVLRVRTLVRELDVRPEGRSYRRHDLASLAPSALPGLLPAHLAGIHLVPVAGDAAVISLATGVQASELADFIAMVDAAPDSTPVELEHISVEHLIAHLPPSASESDIAPTGHPRRFFYLGPESQRHRFLDELREVDRPHPQLRYQLLVIQYQEGSALDYELDLGNSLTNPDSEQAFLGRIGRLLSLDFDVVSTFGYQFAARLSASLSDASAAVVADTTLSALAGESVSFRNTNTYRYRDAVSDPETGELQPTGVVREISSGLIIEITGCLAGESVTMDVAATISRRGSDGSGTGNPPPTSEKVVHTQVRARPGEPVILSGLHQREEEESVQTTPILGQLPLVGPLFQGRRATEDATELAVYIIPRVDRDDDETDLDAELMALYEHNFGTAP